MFLKIKVWILSDYIRSIFSKVLYFPLLAVGVILPWRMRIRYSEFLIIYGPRIKGKILYQPFLRHFALAMKYFQQRKFSKALKEFKKAEEFDRLNNNVNRFIAKCYLELGKKDEYVSEMTKAYKKMREHEKSWKQGKASQPVKASVGK